MMNTIFPTINDNRASVLATFLVLAGVVIFFSSCRKTEWVYYNKPFDRLVSHVWRVEDATLDGSSAIGVCDHDNTLLFSADSTVKMDFGEEKCGPGEQRIVYGRWELEEVNSSVKLTFLGLTYDVKYFTDENLWLNIKDFDVGGTKYDMILKFIAVR